MLSTLGMGLLFVQLVRLRATLELAERRLMVASR